MDIFGSAGSIAAHEAATETFANPGETNRPELCERYLWALAQIRSPESTIVQGFKSLKIAIVSMDNVNK